MRRTYRKIIWFSAGAFALLALKAASTPNAEDAMRTAYLRLVWVYAALLALLAFTIGSSLIPLGVLNPVINLGVAIAKAALIFWFYMELRTSAGLVRIFALAGFGWISLLFILGFSDWLTR